MDFITGQGGGARTRARWEILHRLSPGITILFSSISLYILQTGSVCNRYVQINHVSGKKKKTETAEQLRPLTATILSVLSVRSLK